MQDVAQDLHRTTEAADEVAERLSQMGPLMDRDGYLLDLADEIQRLEDDLRAQAEELEELGAFLVDPVEGLVDFPTEIDGVKVHLCWRPTDETIAHRHAPDEDCDRRQAL